MWAALNYLETVGRVIRKLSGFENSELPLTPDDVMKLEIRSLIVI